MKMRNIETGSEIEVAEHVMTRNFWEFYLEKPEESGIAFGLVMGAETELGYTDMNEIKPYVISRSAPEDCEIMPAPGWEWV